MNTQQANTLQERFQQEFPQVPIGVHTIIWPFPGNQSLCLDGGPRYLDSVEDAEEWLRLAQTFRADPAAREALSMVDASLLLVLRDPPDEEDEL